MLKLNNTDLIDLESHYFDMQNAIIGFNNTIDQKEYIK